MKWPISALPPIDALESIEVEPAAVVDRFTNWTTGNSSLTLFK
jgi:hypothetical protein